MSFTKDRAGSGVVREGEGGVEGKRGWCEVMRGWNEVKRDSIYEAHDIIQKLDVAQHRILEEIAVPAGVS